MKSEDIIMRPPTRNQGPPLDYKFYNLREGKDKNELESNLTELNAADQYFGRGFVSHRDWLAHMARFTAFAKACAPPYKHNVLDVGSGALSLPYVLSQSRKPPKSYWGLDLRMRTSWDKMLSWKKTAVRLVKMDLILDDPTILPEWPAHGFDRVACFEVLEHVPRVHAPQLIQNIYNWTAPGGLVYLSTPNAGRSPSVAANHIGPDGEVREWTYDDKLKLVKDAGFIVEKTYGTFISINDVPKEIWEIPAMAKAREFLWWDWLSLLMAPAFPELANNAIFMMRRPE